MSTISKTSTFEVPKFFQSCSPFRSVGFCLRGLGHGTTASRGRTPLHYAAENGHIAGIERLIEAKAAVDAKTKSGRGLGRRIWGREHHPESMGSLREEVDGMLIRFMVQVLGGFFYFLLETFCQDICIPHSNSSRISGGLTLV